ncbi:unnamed protein product [Rotaria socialis]|uniref:Dynamin N-terminal domain-containing protein n=1 Tax=Rotaria socialis TaxID=392032 RepID=A0A821TX77_9BILA|nr:unnamed protein product [Rotaria socialis]CAF4880310.1 unnamed protein product [Rotaria socialis]
MTTIQQALDTLECHKCLAEKVAANLRSKSSHSTETLYSMCVKRIITEINEEMRKVHQLELRMTVVASMKSGKSTIINALIGENILPTRANAMTIIPTEVIFKHEVKESILYLSNEIIDTIKVIYGELQSYLQNKATNEDKQEVFENEQHIQTVVNKIVNDDNNITMLKTEVVGPTKIQNTLEVINDLVRLYLKLVAKKSLDINEVNFQAFRNNIPRIEVPFSNVINNNYLGNLVIVDTPGPNEAHMCDQLQEIVTTELRKAGMILVVFNYTTLNTETDAKIMQEIAELRAMHGDYDCLYAIVNKVDQRRKGDMSKDDVKRFISKKYGIQEPSTIDENDRRIFETKAIFGLTAKRFLVEYERLKQENIDLTIENMKTVDDLGSELYDFQWETLQETIKIEQLHKGAIDMWRKSGLDELLQTAVHGLMKGISSRVVQSAIGKCQCVDRELIENLKLYQMALSGNAEHLNHEIEELKEEMNLLEEIRSQKHISLEPILTALDCRLESIHANNLYSNRLDELESKSQSLTDLVHRILKHKLQSGIIIGGITTTVYMIYGLLGAAFLGLPLVALGVDYLRTFNMPDSICFPAKSAGLTFLDDVEKLIYEECKKICIEIQERVETDSKQLSQNLYDSLFLKTSNIVKRAKNNLNIPFKMKQPVISKQLCIEFDPPSIETSILETNNSIGLTTCPFFICRENLLKSCDELVKKNLKLIQREIKTWFHDSLEDSFSSYINDLEKYLSSYMVLVQSSFDDMNLSKSDQTKFLQNLQGLINELDEELKKLTA